MAQTTIVKGLNCQNLYDYLRCLSTDTLERLYTHSAICLAVFRELPELARHFVLQTLAVEHPLPQVVVGSWIKPAYSKEHVESTKTLKDLKLWVELPMSGGLPGWSLNATFRRNLRTALFGGGTVWSTCIPLESDKHARDITFLDSYAMERWECVLHYMVGAQPSAKRISNDAVRVLLQAGLMRHEEADGTPVISPSGFQFLLMDTASQVWHFMLQYLETLESRNLDLVECLAFLFQLSFLTIGKDYSTEQMSEPLQDFLQHLREFGLVYQRKRTCGRFYPTRLAISLASGVPKGKVDVHREGYIIVETNYRVYAYTDSDLQVALISLFSELEYRFPNLLVSIISRESVRQALRSGITAEQIITFLRMHSHPEAKREYPTIPPTVTDQIRLWEIERDRFKFTEGVLYDQFLSVQDFETLRNFARDMDALIWDNPANRVVVVSRTGHDEVKRFWKRQKQGM